MSDSFDDAPAEAPVVQGHLDDLRIVDAQIVNPLTPPDPTSGVTPIEEINAHKNLAGQALADLDLLLADLSWIAGLPAYYSTNPDVELTLRGTSLSEEQRGMASAWTETGPGFDAIAASCKSITFTNDRQMLLDYVRSLSDDPPIIGGQCASLSNDRIRCALAVLEGGIIANESEMIEAGYHAYLLYENLGLSV